MYVLKGVRVYQLSSGQSLFMSIFLRPHGLQHARLPCHYQLLELTKTHVHRISYAIQPAHPLLSPFPPAFNLSSIRVFSNESVLPIRWPKYWSFSFSIRPSNNIQNRFPLGLTGLITLQSKGLSRVFSNITIQSINSLVLSFLYGPTLIYIHDYWKNHNFDWTDLCEQSNVSAFFWFFFGEKQEHYFNLTSTVTLCNSTGKW